MLSLVELAPTFDYAAQTQCDVPACPVCQRGNASVPTTDRYGYAIGVSECPCGFAYLNPQMDAAGYDAFYNEAYRPLVYAANKTSTPRTGGQNRGRAMGLNLSALTPKRPLMTVCDVGGSHGAVTEGFCQVWPAETVTVIDPNADELAIAAPRGFRTKQAQIESFPELPAQDVLLCAQTFDHLRDPLGALAWLKASCVVGGWLFLDIVDAQKWARLQHATHYLWKLDHPSYWTPPVIVRTVKQAGWRIRARGYCSWTPAAYHYGLWCQKES